jgi:protein-L-isoaspartate(D-aspartate) O-methyltransferase
MGALRMVDCPADPNRKLSKGAYQMKALSERVVLTLLAGALLLGPGLAVSLSGCAGQGADDNGEESGEEDVSYKEAREQMVATQIRSRGIKDKRVLEAMEKVPRHLFVPETYRPQAYSDSPLPIGYGQTISQPYIVALMTEALKIEPGDKVFEVGTGSGYQAAVLAEMGAEVFTMEIVEELVASAGDVFNVLNYSKIQLRLGDAYQGWVEHSPFDAVIVTAAPEHVPQPLIDQLKVGGRMVVPVGGRFQDLVVMTKTTDGLERESLGPVIFVPMTGEARDKPAGGQ